KTAEHHPRGQACSRLPHLPCAGGTLTFQEIVLVRYPTHGYKNCRLSGGDLAACNVAPIEQASHNIGVNIGGQHRPRAVAVMPRPKLWDCKRRIEMEDHVMSFVRNGYAVRTGRGFLGVLFSASLALALCGHGTATAQEVKQIKLTDKHIQGFMAAYEDIAKVYAGAESDKPDPKVDAQAAVIAKKMALRVSPNMTKS